MSVAAERSRSRSVATRREYEARRGAVLASQRLRIVFAAAAVAREEGLPELSVATIVARSGVSRRTFYEIFENREACLLAAFEEGVTRAAASVVPAFTAERDIRDGLRAGLAALLAFLDDERELGGFGVVEALGAGARVLQRRSEVLRVLVDAVDRARTECGQALELSVVTAEGVVGAVFSILHSRLRAEPRASVATLQRELMGIVVNPYFGHAASEAELQRPAPHRSGARRLGASRATQLRIRWTYRTIVVLNAIAKAPGSSNRQVGQAAGIGDAGQVSKLLARLERIGLIETPAAARGAANAWRLTVEGEEAIATLASGLRDGNAP